jgi:hypothetical protein
MSTEYTTEEIRDGCADLWGNVKCMTCSRLLGYIQALLKAQDWLPIETVPKDGTEVRLAHANSQWIDQWIAEPSFDNGGSTQKGRGSFPRGNLYLSL